MRVIIKGRKNLKIPEDLRKYAEKKFGKFKDRLSDLVLLEVELADIFGPQGGVDKVVDLTFNLPGEKKAIHLSERSEDFKKSIDLIQEKLEREIEEFKEKETFQDTDHRLREGIARVH